jgi:DNA-directed RNA polymerase specialized sigma24 family protein
VDAHVKAGLLDLVDSAVEAGWSARRAAARLGVDDARLDRWWHRRAAGTLADRAPGGAPLHGLLDGERDAIVGLFEAWGDIDRSHRKLAHRGSRLGLVHVSESTVLRVLTAEGLTRDILLELPAEHREMIVLRYILGWQIKEVATHLGLLENTVSVTLRRIFQRIRDRWPSE